MTRNEVELLDKLIDAKITRLLTATQITIDPAFQDEKIMQVMLPIETEIERIKLALLTPKLEQL